LPPRGCSAASTYADVELRGQLGGSESNSIACCAVAFAARLRSLAGAYAFVGFLGLQYGETNFPQPQSDTAQLVESQSGTASGLLGS